VKRSDEAIVFHGVGDIRLDVKEPKITTPSFVLPASAICGADLHFVRGTVPDMVSGTILGHEGVGLVEVGKEVGNLKVGDRGVNPSTIVCGSCASSGSDRVKERSIRVQLVGEF
jgi:threonine dehydrogenase-like Zn-dependent dehydrogenase